MPVQRAARRGVRVQRHEHVAARRPRRSRCAPRARACGRRCASSPPRSRAPRSLGREREREPQRDVLLAQRRPTPIAPGSLAAVAGSSTTVAACAGRRAGAAAPDGGAGVGVRRATSAPGARRLGRCAAVDVDHEPVGRGELRARGGARSAARSSTTRARALVFWPIRTPRSRPSPDRHRRRAIARADPDAGEVEVEALGRPLARRRQASAACASSAASPDSSITTRV